MCLTVKDVPQSAAGANWRIFSLHEVLVGDVGVPYPEAGDGSSLTDGTDGSLLFPDNIFEEKPRVCSSFNLVQFF